MNGNSGRAFTAAAAGLGVLVVVLSIALVMQMATASRLDGRIAEEKARLNQANRQLCECVGWQKDYRELSLRLGGRMRKCTWSDQMPFMVDQLGGIVEPRGLKIDTLQPQPMTTAKRILRFPLRVGLHTDLATLTSVLEDMDRTVPLLAIERLDVRRSQERTGRLQVDATVASFVVLDSRAPLEERRTVQPVMTSEPEETAQAAPQPQPSAQPKAQPKPALQPNTDGVTAASSIKRLAAAARPARKAAEDAKKAKRARKRAKDRPESAADGGDLR